MITEVFIRTVGVGHCCPFFRAKELASMAFSGNTLPSKDGPLPLGWFQWGFSLLACHSGLRREGQASQSPKHMFSSESRNHRRSVAFRLRGSPQLWRWCTGGISGSHSSLGLVSHMENEDWASGSPRSFWAWNLKKSQFVALKEGQNLWVTKYNWFMWILIIRW